MSIWELRRIAVTLAVIDAAALVAVAAVCAAIGRTDRADFATGLLVAAFALAVVAVGYGGNIAPVAIPFRKQTYPAGPPYGGELELVAQEQARNLDHHRAQERTASGLLVFGLAGLTLVPLAATILFA
jgi:hypothetical protein